jgi:glycosyltransferase involved in cell wall biosynthesis
MRKPSICHVRGFDKPSFFDRLFASFASKIIYISRAVEANYTAHGIQRSKGKVIYNALDLGDYTVGSDGAAIRTAVRAEFGWSAHTPLVGVVGRLDWWKGHEYFLEAFAQVAQGLPALRGLIVGEPEATPKNREYYQKLLGLTDTLKLQEQMVFTGFRSDIPRLMCALDVVVLSSSTPEPFGRVLLEGMAASRPVVATAAGGVLEIIQDGVTGMLVAPKDASAMAQAIRKLLKDREQADRLGQAARRCVEEKFAIQQHVLQVQDLYDAVLS